MRTRIPVAALFSLFAFPSCSCLVPVAAHPPGRVDVHGRAIYDSGEPMVDVRVFVTGSAAVRTDADGAFGFSDVAVPYDLVVEVPTTPTDLLIYSGLTRPDPTATVFNGHGDRAGMHEAILTGGVLGGTGWPAPADFQTVIAAVSSDERLNDAEVQAETYGGFTLHPSWYGADRVAASIHAIQWIRGADDLPTTFLYGSVSATEFVSGKGSSDCTITLEPLPTRTVRMRVEVPAGLIHYERTWRFHVPGAQLLQFAREDGELSNTREFAVPVHPDLALDVAAFAMAPDGSSGFSSVSRRIDANATEVVYTLPPLPYALEPAEGATGVSPRFMLRWKSTGGAAFLYVEASNRDGYPVEGMRVIAGGDHWTLPDLSPLGFPAPTSNHIDWRVTVNTELESADDCASGNLVTVLFDSPESLSQATSPQVSFVTGE